MQNTVQPPLFIPVKVDEGGTIFSMQKTLLSPFLGPIRVNHCRSIFTVVLALLAIRVGTIAVYYCRTIGSMNLAVLKPLLRAVATNDSRPVRPVADEFTVLVIAPTPLRLALIAQAVAKLIAATGNGVPLAVQPPFGHSIGIHNRGKIALSVKLPLPTPLLGSIRELQCGSVVAVQNPIDATFDDGNDQSVFRR